MRIPSTASCTCREKGVLRGSKKVCQGGEKVYDRGVKKGVSAW